MRGTAPKSEQQKKNTNIAWTHLKTHAMLKQENHNKNGLGREFGSLKTRDFSAAIEREDPRPASNLLEACPLRFPCCLTILRSYKWSINSLNSSTTTFQQVHSYLVYTPTKLFVSYWSPWTCNFWVTMVVTFHIHLCYSSTGDICYNFILMVALWYLYFGIWKKTGKVDLALLWAERYQGGAAVYI